MEQDGFFLSFDMLRIIIFNKKLLLLLKIMSASDFSLQINNGERRLWEQKPAVIGQIFAPCQIYVFFSFCQF